MGSTASRSKAAPVKSVSSAQNHVAARLYGRELREQSFRLLWSGRKVNKENLFTLMIDESDTIMRGANLGDRPLRAKPDFSQK